MKPREESTQLGPSSHLYKGPKGKAASVEPDASAPRRDTPWGQGAKAKLVPVGFSFPQELGGRSFTWTRDDQDDLAAKVAALPPHKKTFVVQHIEELLSEKTKKFGLNDYRTQEWKDYLSTARRSSRKKSSKKKKGNKNKGMRKKRAQAEENG